MEKFKSLPKHYFTSESIASEKMNIKRKRPHLDTRKKAIFSPPSPSLISNTLEGVPTMEGVPSPNRSGRDEVMLINLMGGWIYWNLLIMRGLWIWIYMVLTSPRLIKGLAMNVFKLDWIGS